MLKSVNTCRHLDATIDGATTLLWIPNRKRRTRRIQLMVKKGWFKRDCGSDICLVCESHSQVHAPTAVQTEITMSTILHSLAVGCSLSITSVNLLSNAFRSSVCSADMLWLESTWQHETLWLNRDSFKKQAQAFTWSWSPNMSIRKGRIWTSYFKASLRNCYHFYQFFSFFNVVC